MSVVAASMTAATIIISKFEHIAGKSADDSAKFGLVVVGHRQALHLPEQSPPERKLHALAGGGHHQDCVSL